MIDIPWWVLYPGGRLLVLITTTFLLFSLYVAYIHWKYSHLPSPKISSFYLGHVADIVAIKKESGTDADPLIALTQKWSKEVGDLFVIYIIYKPQVITVNPEDVKRLVTGESIGKPVQIVCHLISLFGRRFMGCGLVTIPDYETWKPQRKLYDSSFKRSSLKDLLPMFNECCDTFLDGLRPHADGKREVDITKAIHEVAFNIISTVAFSSDFNKMWDSKSLGLKYAKQSSLSYLTLCCTKGIGKSLWSLFPSLLQVLHPHEVAIYRESVDAIRKIGRDCIEKRIKAVINGEEVPNDTLTKMLQGCGANKSVDIEALVDNFVTFYVAGQETTANTLSFAVILINQHPEVLDRLLCEIQDVLGDRKEVTGDDLDKMKYTEQVIHEVLRVYPPVVAIAKESPKGGITLRGFHIPKGTTIALYQAVMCKNPKYFNDPERFDPSRFDDSKERPGPYVYFPFSVGHRSCIGRHFAMIEAKVILTRLLQTFKVTPDPSYKIAVEQLLTQHPKGGIPCTLQEIPV